MALKHDLLKSSFLTPISVSTAGGYNSVLNRSYHDISSVSAHFFIVSRSNFDWRVQFIHYLLHVIDCS